jgi:two-component system phosphate regulon sensor histidine kinase PhoR
VFLKIHHKLTLIFGVILAVILIITFSFLSYALQQDVDQQTEETLAFKTRFALAFVQERLPTLSDPKQIDALVDQIAVILGVHATLIAEDGVVLGDSHLASEQSGVLENHLYWPEVQDALSKGWGESRRGSFTQRAEILYAAALFSNGSNRMVIRLEVPVSEIHNTMARINRLLLVTLVLIFFFSWALSFFALIYFTKPLREMGRLAKHIAAGDFSQKIYVKSKDDIEELASAINVMTEQVRLRIEEAAAGKSWLEAVLLSMFEGVLAVDRQGDILLMNQTLRDILQVKVNPIGKKSLALVRNIKVQEIIQKSLTLKAGVYSSEISFLFPQEKILLIHASPINRMGEVEGVVLVFHDITALRRLERIRQEFVANVSHELRTPIASIKGYAETLIDGAVDDKEHAMEFLKIIYADAERLARLIDDILNLSKIESGTLKMSLRPCMIKPVIDRVVSGLHWQLIEKELSMDVHITDDIPLVLADEDRMAQVFQNLIDNAIKYTPRKGRIAISCRIGKVKIDGRLGISDLADSHQTSVELSTDKRNHLLQIDVQDNGIGIPPEDLPRIFERFYRVDKARSRDLGGTGLGLSIVKHIVQAHNGEVFVQSAVGQGSTFSVTIPLA